MTASQNGYIRAGLKIASKGEHHFKVAALLVRGGRILNIGLNRNKTDPMFALDPSLNRNVGPLRKVNKLHAEMCALDDMDPKLIRGADMVIIRASPKKGVGLARPCSICMRVLKEAGIKRIHYTEDYTGMTTEKL